MDGTLQIWDADTGAEVVRPAGHTGWIQECAYSPDGHRIVSASSDGTLRLWHPETGAEVAVLGGGTIRVEACAYSSDGRFIVSGAADSQLRIWDATTGTEIATLTGNRYGPAKGLAFSPDGKRIVSASIDGLVAWDAATGTRLRCLIEDSGAEDCAYSPDGVRIVFASSRKGLTLVEAATGAPIVKLSAGASYFCSYSPESDRIVSNSGIWDARSWTQLATFEGGADQRHCAFSPDGRRIVSVSAYAVKVWDVARLIEASAAWSTSEQPLHRGWVNDCSFSPEGHRLVSGSARGELTLWDAETGLQAATRAAHSCGVDACVYSTDGRRIISFGGERYKRPELKLWDARSNREVATLVGHESHLNAIGFSPEGSRIATASNDATVRLWDAETGAHILTLAGPEHGYAYACAFSPDGHRLVVAFGYELWVWNGETGERLAVLKGHTHQVKALAFSPDGCRIVSASWDKTLRVWDAETGEERSRLEGHTDGVVACCYSPDGTRCVSASGDRSLRIWDADTGAHLTTLAGHKEGVNCCAYSSDGCRIISASGDGGAASRSDDDTIRAWDAYTGQELACFMVGRPVTTLAVARGGNVLATGDQRGGAFVLRLVTGTSGAAAATPVRVFRYPAGRWDDKPSVHCRTCGLWMELSADGTRGAASWECPHCGQSLRLSPYVVDGRAQESKLEASQRLMSDLEHELSRVRGLAGEGRFEEAVRLLEELPTSSERLERRKAVLADEIRRAHEASTVHERVQTATREAQRLVNQGLIAAARDEIQRIPDVPAAAEMKANLLTQMDQAAQEMIRMKDEAADIIDKLEAMGISRSSIADVARQNGVDIDNALQLRSLLEAMRPHLPRAVEQKAFSHKPKPHGPPAR